MRAKDNTKKDSGCTAVLHIFSQSSGDSRSKGGLKVQVACESIELAETSFKIWLFFLIYMN